MSPHLGLWPVILLLALWSAPLPAEQPVVGNATLKMELDGSWLELETTARLAGAIDRLTWKGQEFVDSFDHGRQIQSASNFDAGFDRMIPETFNPTEAGSRHDHTGPTSSSRLLEWEHDNTTLRATTQMAFWLRPGEKSFGNLARNKTILSRHLLHKQITLAAHGLPHVIRFDITFTIPEDEGHHYAQFETLTGYMPPEFSRFLTWNPKTNELKPIDEGPGEQPLPLIFALPSGTQAMGIYSPDQPSPGWEQAGYGRFSFQQEKVVKWNCVHRIRSDASPLAGESYRYRCYLAVGDLEHVQAAFKALHLLIGGRSERPAD